MKQIEKKEPQFFSDYLKPDSWRELSKNIGEDIRVYILSGLANDETEVPAEQHFQCAYTETAIEPESRSSHIDHFRKQSLFPALVFDWSNLFAACNSEDYGAKHKDKKVNQADYDLLIHPASENPADFLTYTLTGKIIDLSDEEDSLEYKKARLTIDLFNLNDKSLHDQRRTVSKQVQAFYDQLPLEVIKKEIGRFDSFIEFVFEACTKMKQQGT